MWLFDDRRRGTHDATINWGERNPFAISLTQDWGVNGSSVRGESGTHYKTNGMVSIENEGGMDHRTWICCHAVFLPTPFDPQQRNAPVIAVRVELRYRGM